VAFRKNVKAGYFLRLFSAESQHDFRIDVCIGISLHLEHYCSNEHVAVTGRCRPVSPRGPVFSWLENRPQALSYRPDIVIMLQLQRTAVPSGRRV